MRTHRRSSVSVVDFVLLLLLPCAAAAFSNSPSSLTLKTNRDGGSGCASCHTADAAMTVAITGPTALNRGQSGTYTVSATRPGVADGTRMGLAAASSDAGSLAVVAGMPTVLQSGEIIHATSAGALRTTTSTTATYQFTYTMPAGAATGSSHTLYTVAAIGFAGGYKHANNFVVTTRPLATTAVTPSGATSSSVNVAWTGGGPEYRVVYKTGAVAPANESDGTTLDVGSATSTPITGLSASTQYTVAVFSKVAGQFIFATTAASATFSTTASAAGQRFVNVATGTDTGGCTSAGSPCKTITFAMGQAITGSPGDSITVAPGTYNQASGEVFPIAIKSGVQLVSSAGAAATIVDATGANARVFVASGANASTVLQGFTIRGGFHQPPANGTNAQGGGLFIDNLSAIRVRRNVFSGNESRGYSGVTPTFVSGGEAYGGAIVSSNASPVIENNVFQGNTVRGGQGVSRFDGAAGGSAGSGHGGAIFIGGGAATLVNNTFHGNQALGGAGGSSNASGGGSGGNAFNGAVEAANTVIANNIFVANTAAAGAGGGGSPAGSTGVSFNGALNDNGGPSTTNNLFFGNTAGSNGDTTGLNAVTADPAFIAAPNDLRVPSTSPANGAGTGTNAPALDLDGRTRGVPPAIGAFEPGPIVYALLLEGAQQVPPVSTSASGSGTATFNRGSRQLSLRLAYGGLSSTETMAHIHGPGARGANAGILYNLALGSPKTDAVTITVPQVADLLAGNLYVNVHTANFGNGELRAQIDTLATAVSPATVDFGGQSMGTTSPPIRVTFTNLGYDAVSLTGANVSNPQFTAVPAGCTGIPVGGTCGIDVTFSPVPGAGPLNATSPVNGTLTITTDRPGGPYVVSLAGTAEKSLIAHYYRSILRRAPDGAGKAFWQSEAARLVQLGANVNETWYLMATFFYFSPEYVAFGRSSTEFVTDLYNTFFNRAPDAGGLNFWTGQMANGVPKEIVLVSFMLSAEFVSFTQGIFGNTAARAEVDAVGDFYRGLLSRLPDNAGFDYWRGRFRTAQCAGSAQVAQEADSISSQFANGPEYANRARTNPQYVGDLYNAFLRRGGDQGGVQFWINSLNQGMSREAMRQEFFKSPEFTNRVNAITAQGCLP